MDFIYASLIIFTVLGIGFTIPFMNEKIPFDKPMCFMRLALSMYQGLSNSLLNHRINIHGRRIIYVLHSALFSFTIISELVIALLADIVRYGIKLFTLIFQERD